MQRVLTNGGILGSEQLKMLNRKKIFGSRKSFCFFAKFAEKNLGDFWSWNLPILSLAFHDSEIVGRD